MSEVIRYRSAEGKIDQKSNVQNLHIASSEKPVCAALRGMYQWGLAGRAPV
jgi:hypothetical protein